jgi:hypothetical protein
MSDCESKSEPVLPAWSAYAGLPFNLAERRPLVILEESDDAFIVEGFYHRAAFWQAIVPKHGVAEIVGQRMNFSRPKRQADGTTRASLFFLNHVQARVQMRPEHALRLYAPGSDRAGEPAHLVGDFAYSVEAVGPLGRSWNLSDALLGNLAIVHRFLSIEDVAFERIMREHRTIVQSPPLPVEAEFKNRLLAEAIRESHSTGLTRPYFMMRPPFSATNCASEPLKLLDEVLRTPRRRRLLRRYPIHPRAYLKLRGLWQEGQVVPTLNEELAEWLKSDAARERREIHVNKKKQMPKETPSHEISYWKRVTSVFRALRVRR